MRFGGSIHLMKYSELLGWLGEGVVLVLVRVVMRACRPVTAQPYESPKCWHERILS